MSINVGLTAENSFGSIVGFSGKIINVEDLKMRKKNNTNVLLIHGDQDDIVSPTHLLEAKDFL
jgi:phospholipase/carboxylesterase